MQAAGGLLSERLNARDPILNGRVITADGPTAELLADGELLSRHRLELPFGFTLVGGHRTSGTFDPV